MDCGNSRRLVVCIGPGGPELLTSTSFPQTIRHLLDIAVARCEVFSLNKFSAPASVHVHFLSIDDLARFRFL